MRTWTWKVPAVTTTKIAAPDPGPGPSNDAGGRADVALIDAFARGLGDWAGEPEEFKPVPSRNQLKKWIEAGRVTCGKDVLKPNSRLAPGMRVEIRVPEPERLELEPEDRPIDILFQDEHIVVVNKPPGLTVHPSDTQKEGTLVHALLFHIKDLSGIGGKLRPGIVHRIDKDTSGALVITKSDAAHRALAETFANHDIERAYWALCYGAPKEREGEIKSRIARNPADRKKMANVTTDGEGRHAVTRYQVLEEFAQPRARPFATWIEARLETGRTHQVRVHLTGIGHSLLGDPVYGTPSERHTKWLALPMDVREVVRALPGQALHARVLGFRHPITGTALRFEAPPPPAFQVVLDTLKRYG